MLRTGPWPKFEVLWAYVPGLFLLNSEFLVYMLPLLLVLDGCWLRWECTMIVEDGPNGVLWSLTDSESVLGGCGTHLLAGGLPRWHGLHNHNRWPVVASPIAVWSKVCGRVPLNKFSLVGYSRPSYPFINYHIVRLFGCVGWFLIIANESVGDKPVCTMYKAGALSGVDTTVQALCL